MKITDIETILLSCKIPEEKTWRLGGLSGQPGWKGVKADMSSLRCIQMRV